MIRLKNLLTEQLKRVDRLAIGNLILTDVMVNCKPNDEQPNCIITFNETNIMENVVDMHNPYYTFGKRRSDYGSANPRPYYEFDASLTVKLVTPNEIDYELVVTPAREQKQYAGEVDIEEIQKEIRGMLRKEIEQEMPFPRSADTNSFTRNVLDALGLN